MRDVMKVDHGCYTTDLDDVVGLRELRGGAATTRNAEGVGMAMPVRVYLRLMTERSDRFRALVHRP